MPTHLKPLSLLALLAAAAPLAAQEATAPAETPAPDAAPEAPADAQPEAPAAEQPAPEAPAEGAAPGTAAGDLALGQPVEGAGGEPQVGQPYIREEFGDWSVRCVRAEEGPDPCQLYQLLYDGEGNTVAEISMFPLPPGGEASAGATIVVPLETLLPEGLRISVDGTAERRYPLTLCFRAGCVARVGFTDEEIQQFKRGNSAQLSLVPAAAPDQVVDLTISLSGFTAGFDNMVAEASAAAQ